MTVTYNTALSIYSTPLYSVFLPLRVINVRLLYNETPVARSKNNSTHTATHTLTAILLLVQLRKSIRNNLQTVVFDQFDSQRSKKQKFFIFEPKLCPPPLICLHNFSLRTHSRRPSPWLVQEEEEGRWCCRNPISCV